MSAPVPPVPGHLRPLTGLRFLWVYPAHSEGRVAAEEAYLGRVRRRGFRVEGFGIPCAGGWWPFSELDRRWRAGDRELARIHEQLGPALQDAEVVIAAGGAMLHPDFLGQFPACKVFLCADDPENSEELSRPVAPHFDHCYVVNPACLDDYRSWGCRRVQWLFPVLRPHRFDPTLTGNDILHGTRGNDIALFCERVLDLSDRAERVEALVRAFPRALVRGRGWPGGFLSDREMVAAYTDTKIGWNLHNSVGPCNTRLLELPANGVLQLCDNREHLGRVFVPDEEVVAYDSVEECIDKTRYYLAHEDERREIAAAGWRRVHRDYTEDRHWDRILAGIADRVAPAPGPRPPEVHSRRPRVWLLADRRGWAYDQEVRGMAAQLADEFECRIAYVAEEPDLDAWDHDLVFVCFWGETWHRRFTGDPRRVIKQISSHRWQEQGEHGPLTVGEFAERHLRDAAWLTATSRRLQRIVSPVRRVAHTPQGVDLDRFHPPTGDRRGPLVLGWAGNAADPCKGLHEVIVPAARGHELRVADGDLDVEEMADFYRSIDVLCIASTAEGEPRTLIEAMASGCFPVTVDVGIVPELVEPGVGGLVVERDVEAFRRAFDWCARNLGQVRRQGAANARRIAAGRSWPAVDRGYRSVFRRAVAALRRPLGEGSEETAPPLMARLKADYEAHLATVNPGELEDTHRAASVYYRAELTPVLPADRGARILDVGAGFGHLLRFLAEHGYSDLEGVEIDERLQATAARMLGDRARVHRADALEVLAGREGTYDLITAYDILEHFPLEEAARFAGLVRRALRPGGRAVFRTPNMANVLGCYSRYMDLTHQVGFTEQSLAQLLRAAGFDGSELVEPRIDDPELARGIEESRELHRKLFVTMDRSAPRCMDKNLVMAGQMAGAPAAAPEPARPEVLFVVDAPGWAHDRKTDNLIRCLAGRFDGRKVLQSELAASDLEGADLVVIWYWRQVQSLRPLLPALYACRGRTLFGVCSHNELEGPMRDPGLQVLRELGRAVFTHNERLEAEVRPLVGGDRWCLPNGVDTGFFTPGPARPDDGVLRVGWAGSLDNFGAEMRGFSTVIRPATARLEGVELVTAVREARMRSQEEMLAFYRGLDVHVCASRVEGTPNPCLEAAACGVPVVTTPVGNMPELIEHGIHGLFIDRDPTSLARALTALRADPEHRRRMGRALRSRVESWDWRHRAEGFARLFAHTLAVRDGAAADPARSAVLTP